MVREKDFAAMAGFQDDNADGAAERAYAAAAQALGQQPAAVPDMHDDAAFEPPVAEPDALEPLVEAEAESEPAPAAEGPQVTAWAADEPAASPLEMPRLKGKRGAKSAVKAPAMISAPKLAPISAEPMVPVLAVPAFIDQPEEVPMETTDTTTKFKDAMSGMQDKAKDAFAKSSATVGEYGDFAKGNVEAVVQSTKILASGLQELGSQYVADTKAAFETMTADVKELAAVKSPTDFVKLHSEILRRNFDSTMALSTKTGEAMLKLTNDMMAPLSGRVSLAVEKVRKVA